jgi:CHAT domain-containing protein
LAEALGKTEDALAYRQLANELLVSATQHFWSAEVGAYVNNLPRLKEEKTPVMDELTLTFSVWAGLCPEGRIDATLDLFTLSACRTALGDADSELGFAGLALQAGSRSAIGSLWYVDDVATSALFVQFYRFLDQGIPKAEALQFTRRAMATGAMKLVRDQVIGANGEVLLSNLTTAQQRRIAGGLQHPFYWAGIQLLGTPW